jgi:tetratricopeptide (TPR) repeat protein
MRRVLFSAAALVAFAAPASAQAPQLAEQWTRCVNAGFTFEVDVAVNACTAIIGAQIETQENVAIAHYNRGKEHARGRSWAAALQDYDRAIELGYRDAGSYYARGLAHYENRQYDLAVADYNEVLTRDANNLDALGGRADAYQYGLRDYDRAIADYDALLARRETASDFLRRGNAYQYGKQDLDRAMADYDRALQSDANAAVGVDRGNIFYARGDYAQALAQYDAAFVRDPTEVAAVFNRGNAKWALNDVPGAIEDWTRTLSIDPNYADALGNRGDAYRSQERYDQALVDLDRALAIRVNAMDLHNRGLAYEYGLRDPIRAIADFDQAVSLDPNNPVYRNSACWARAVAERELDVARAHCDAAIAADPNADFLDSRGLLNLRENRFQDAWNDFDAAVCANETHAHARYGRGISALRLGRTAEGQADLTAARALDNDVTRTWEEYGLTP